MVRCSSAGSTLAGTLPGVVPPPWLASATI